RHPSLYGNADRIGKPTHKSDILTYRQPAAYAERIGAVIDHRTVLAAVTEIFVIGHVLRMNTGEPRKIVAPAEFGHTVFDALLIELRKGFSFEFEALFGRDAEIRLRSFGDGSRAGFTDASAVRSLNGSHLSGGTDGKTNYEC